MNSNRQHTAPRRILGLHKASLLRVLSFSCAACFTTPLWAWGIGSQCVEEGKQRTRQKENEGIVLAGASVRLLGSPSEQGSQFALRYTLRFPSKNHYMTWPAKFGPWVGDYTVIYPEEKLFEADTAYEYEVVFNTTQALPPAPKASPRFSFSHQRTTPAQITAPTKVIIGLSAGSKEDWACGMRRIEIPIDTAPIKIRLAPAAAQN